VVLPDRIVLRSTEVAVITHRSTNLFLWNYEFELFGTIAPSLPLATTLVFAW